MAWQVAIKAKKSFGAPLKGFQIALFILIKITHKLSGADPFYFWKG